MIMDMDMGTITDTNMGTITDMGTITNMGTITDMGMIMDMGMITATVTVTTMKAMTTATELGISAESQARQGLRCFRNRTSLQSKSLNCRSPQDMALPTSSPHLQVVLNSLLWIRNLERPLVRMTIKMFSRIPWAASLVIKA